MSINVISTLKPINNAPFPVVEDNDFKGGFRVVSTIVDRDNIVTANRKEGMTVYCIATSTFYILTGGISNANWAIWSSLGPSPTLGNVIYWEPTEDWAALNVKITATANKCIILVKNPTTGNRDIPAGSYNWRNLYWFGVDSIPGNYPIRFLDGATFQTDGACINAENLAFQFYQISTTKVIPATCTNISLNLQSCILNNYHCTLIPIDINYNAMINLISTSVQTGVILSTWEPMFLIKSGVTAASINFYSCSLYAATNIPAIIRTEIGSYLYISYDANTTFFNDIDFTRNHGFSTTLVDGYPSTYEVLPATSANNVFYDDDLVNPQIFSNTLLNHERTAQLAIDILKDGYSYLLDGYNYLVNNSGNAGHGSVSSEVVKTSNYTITGTDSEIIPVDTTSNPVTITLPATPSISKIYTIVDVGGYANTNYITLNGNGPNIVGAATYLIDIEYTAITCWYNGTTWSII